MSSKDADAAAWTELKIPKNAQNVVTETDEQVKDDGTRVNTTTTTMKTKAVNSETMVKQKVIKTVEAEEVIEETVYDCLCCCPFLRRFDKDTRARRRSGNNNTSSNN